MSSILGIDPATQIVRMVGDDTKSERIFAARQGFDIVTVSDEMARLAYGQKWPLWTLIGVDYAAGKDISVEISARRPLPAVESES